jgi:hypothetical protein
MRLYAPSAGLGYSSGARVSCVRDRYVVRELSGYGGASQRAPLQTDVIVMDTWYCWHVVYAASTAKQVPTAGGGARTYDEKLIAARSSAARTLNQEHEAWVTAIDVTTASRKDASR